MFSKQEFAVEKVLEKETQKIVSFSKCQERTEMVL